jgi:NDP-sugar pyrophosphorylase family protein
VSAIRSGAVIAAGEGSRLKSLGVPKPLIEVDGRPLIAHVLSRFEAAGIERAAVIFNDAGRDAEPYVRERFGALVETIVVKTTRSSLESFREVLAVAPPGRLLVSTIDAFCPVEEFVRFVQLASATPSSTTVLAVTRFVDDEKPLWVTASHDGRVRAIGGDHGDAVTAGIYVFPERVRKLGIPPGLGRLRDFLAMLAAADEPIEAIEIPKVVDIDRPSDLEEAEALAREDAYFHAAPAGEKRR